jgi:hypothetical protein
MLEGSRIVDKAAQELSPDEFKNSSIRDVMSAVFNFHKENKEITAPKLINHFSQSPEIAALITEAVGALEMIGDKDKALVECIAAMKRDCIRERMDMIQDAIRAAHSRNDEAKVAELAGEFNRLNNEVRKMAKV